MDIKKLIQTTEETIFYLLFAIIQFPKTLFYVLVKPKWLAKYVDSEFQKPENRFEKYVPPFLFWLILGIVPHYILILYGFDQSESEELQIAYSSIGWYVKVTTLIVFYIAPPITAAFVIERLKSKSMSKEGLKRELYIQLYLFAPVQLYYLTMFMEEDTALFETVVIVILLLLLWFFVVELIIIAQRLKVGFIKAFGAMILMYFLSFVFIGISMLIIAVCNYESINALVDAWMMEPV